MDQIILKLKSELSLAKMNHQASNNKATALTLSGTKLALQIARRVQSGQSLDEVIDDLDNPESEDAKFAIKLLKRALQPTNQPIITIGEDTTQEIKETADEVTHVNPLPAADDEGLTDKNNLPVAPEVVQEAANTAQKAAETATEAAETATDAADTADTAAESAQIAAESAQEAADNAQKAAETATEAAQELKKK